MNNFELYGFTADFAGEILKEVGDKLYGIARDRPIAWDKHTGARISDWATWITTDLTPIKKEWSEDEINFPCLLVRDNRYTGNIEDMIICHNIKNWSVLFSKTWRLATKAERDAIFCKED